MLCPDADPHRGECLRGGRLGGIDHRHTEGVLDRLAMPRHTGASDRIAMTPNFSPSSSAAA
jgi:hypothetical protein